MEFPEPSVGLVSDESDAEHDIEGSNLGEYVSSPIVALIRRRAWDQMIEECQSNVEAFAARRDPISGNTFLHDLFETSPESFSPPLNVVQMITQSCPELVMVRNHQGCLPLHLACTARTSVKVMAALIRSSQQSTDIPNYAGWCPLHLLCHYGCRVECIRIILEASVSSVQQLDKVFCRTPLQLLNASQNLKSFHSSLDELRRIRKRQRDTNYCSPGDAIAIERLGGSEFWQKVKLLVLAEHIGRALAKNDDAKSALLFSFISIQSSCPPALFEFAMLLQVEELLEPNSDGNLPLHLASSISKPSRILDVLLAMPVAARRLDCTGQLPLQIVLGRFPSIAWCCLIESLIVANPMAIEALNIDVRLFPLIFERIGCSAGYNPVQKRKGINQLLEMISAAPTLFCKH